MELLTRPHSQLGGDISHTTTVIRSVLEYAAPVWHSSLTAEQKDSLENVQKWALFNHLRRTFCQPSLPRVLLRR